MDDAPTADIPPVWAAGQQWTFRVAERELYADGLCDPEQSAIIIHARYAQGDGNALRKLVMHELIHAIDNSAGMLSAFRVHPSDGQGGEVLYHKDDNGKAVYLKPFCLSESMVRLFSESLWITFSDPRNADFMQWLLSDVWAEAWRLFAGNVTGDNTSDRKR